jgi:hypothetical protein
MMATLTDADLYGAWKYTCICKDIQYITFKDDHTFIIKVESHTLISKINSIFNNDFIGYWELKWTPLVNPDPRVKSLLKGRTPDTIDIIKFKVIKADSGVLAALNQKLYQALFPIIMQFGAPKKSLYLLERSRSDA